MHTSASILLTAALLLAPLGATQPGEPLLDTALKKLNGSQYIKDFDISLYGSEARQGKRLTLMLNSRTQYQLTLANDPGNKQDMIVQIFDGDRILGSNFSNGKIFNTFQFLCSRTGLYRLYCYNNGGAAQCKAVLSLVKQYNQTALPQ